MNPQEIAVYLAKQEAEIKVLNNLKMRIPELSERARKISTDILLLAEDIFPAKIFGEKRGAYGKHSEAMFLLRKNLMDGGNITKELIESVTTAAPAQYFWNNLKKIPGVMVGGEKKGKHFLFLAQEKEVLT